jgi:hypothetical protein
MWSRSAPRKSCCAPRSPPLADTGSFHCAHRNLIRDYR